MVWLGCGPLVVLLGLVKGQLVTYVKLDQAVVSSGNSEVCQVVNVDNNKLFTEARPFLGSMGEYLEYLEVYTCSGITTAPEQPGLCMDSQYSPVTQNCVELLFIWSKGMGEGYQESLPADLSGLQAGEGRLLLRATYRLVPDTGKDASGLELTEESSPAGSGEPGGRLVVGHRLPRLIVMPGLQEWKSVSICSADCLDYLEDDWGINLLKVSLFTGISGKSATLSKVSLDGKITQVSSSPLTSGWSEEVVGTGGTGGSAQLLPTDSLVLQCTFDTSGLLAPLTGGVGLGKEHCMAVLTYTGSSAILECRSQPTDYSVTNALGVTLQGGEDDYYDYASDTENIFGSESPDSDITSVFEKRRKRQTNNGEKMVDPFFDEVFTEQGVTILDAMRELNPNSTTAQDINNRLVKESEHAVFCDTREEKMPVMKTSSLEEFAPGVLETSLPEGWPGSGAGQPGSLVATVGALILGLVLA